MRRTKSKSSLFLLEFTFAILIFSLSAAICMQVFASAKRTSQNSDELSSALVCAQSAAEAFKATGGSLDAVASILGGAFNGRDEVAVSYDADWRRTTNPPCYTLLLTSPGDGAASARVYKAGAAEPVYELEIRVPGGDGR